jgi:hypothetical protein
VCGGSCAPGATRCSGNTPQLCNDAGAWADNGAACPYVCTAGACGGSCAPGATRCNANTPQLCNASGAWADNGSACPYVCTAGACGGSCVPGTKECNGNTPQLCNNAGAWADNGSACPYVCTAGVCGGSCTPGAKRCAVTADGTDTCDNTGNWGSTVLCDAAVPFCDPNAHACVACDYVNSTVPCPSGETCQADGSCVAA